MVARVHLHNMRQDRDEAICSFGARLRGQAGICKFLVTCPSCHTAVNYTENVLHNVLTRGLANSEIQLDLLGNKHQDMTLEEVFQSIEAKEASKRSAERLLHTQGVDATRSQYRHAKHEELKQRKVGDPTELCTYCNKSGHDKNAPTRIRRNSCTTYGATCGHCRQPYRFATVCRSKGKQKGPQQTTLPHIVLQQKQRMPSLIHSVLPLASDAIQADTYHLTTTCATTSTIPGYNRHPNPNHFSP